MIKYKNNNMETKLITFFNIKGGIYKTSMSIITAYELAKDKNKNILLWDLDLQENLTQYVYKVNHEDKTTVIHETKLSKSAIFIYDIVKKEKKKSKEQVGVTLDKEIVDKLKTVVIDSNITMSKLFENLLTPLLDDVKIKEKNIEIYNNKNKLKGRRKTE